MVTKQSQYGRKRSKMGAKNERKWSKTVTDFANVTNVAIVAKVAKFANFVKRSLRVRPNFISVTVVLVCFVVYSIFL